VRNQPQYQQCSPPVSRVPNRQVFQQCNPLHSQPHSLPLDDFVYEADDLVTGKNTLFVATGVTNGELVGGVRRDGDWIYTESVVLRGASGTLRRITSEHLTSKWL
jgi:fructose-1,6-bisphosphatase/sedoheptulose 1,7-bisphosphatase-like protein